MPDAFYEKQDAYLQEQLEEKYPLSLNDMQPIRDKLYLWQGDITRLKVDAIVNAIHSQAGFQLRMACQQIMEDQGHDEETGQAKITPALNLPVQYVIHTVGPIIVDKPSLAQMKQLTSSYQQSLELAVEKGLKSIAFPCISTGEFHFPNDLAAKNALKTIEDFQKDHDIIVVINVFKDQDLDIYQSLLT
ncbi:macro domain-containing protein [Streptococcus loxodontisalivarius]|uniref:Protein-ADP-ribose hydrolase n=1 Tax=Streptococcus loxodontisalivarius TaxID=1349415 RepID=A0ABS2PPU0_9STRE|nr:macro domain-containing protein [Streptococcus loxodontisalivarius]MBM7641963.1 O-acetyl-ADP-ribose deacetylase (regulator of RNase III) [Streptococcus loxodontisalivarius]